MRGQVILCSEPHGHMEEGIASGTIYPGMLLEVVPATVDVLGRFTWRPATTTTGSARQIAVALDDPNQGRVPTTVYAAGERLPVYFPLSGEELNMFVKDTLSPGSGEAIAIGDLLGANNAGQLVPNSSYSSTPFTAMETVAAGALSNPPYNDLVFCKRN